MTPADQPDPSEEPTATTPDDPSTSGSAVTGADGDGSADRDIEVPMRVYKAVTVFTTLFAIVTVVGGFVLLDSATNRATASLDEIQPVAALVAIGLILAGAAAYAFSTRFRAEGMGKSKDDTDENTDNG
ncbi:hypothetical protein SAMN05216388_102262 [Halorientalis persicus]|jgi:hypothetical protein|uniref:DUF7315 domain-containing protein n=1 Tax=Halorientalis persicus TaxID=1367881 RepID=A0A1H8TH49_9EURY|nr:hypothetical protein SAMN05216388_102262 [Halorientalis persicus]